MPKEPTAEGEQQRDRIHAFMRAVWKEHGYMPSVTEIADETGLSRTSVYWHLDLLRRTGFITFEDDQRARTLRLTRRRRPRR